jgi:hypothetical protein
MLDVDHVSGRSSEEFVTPTSEAAGPKHTQRDRLSPQG